jgi:hypothetical protein
MKVNKAVRILIVSISILYFKSEISAQEKKWYVGIHLNPGKYELYNKNDWNADSIFIYPVTGNVSSITLGATSTLILNRHIGLTSGLLYQRCSQEYLAKNDPNLPNDYWAMENTFKFLKIPINVQFSTNNEATNQLIVEMGLQTSFLLTYSERFLQRSTNFYSESLLRNRVAKDIDNPSNPNTEFNRFVYKWFLVGANSKIGYRLLLKNSWMIEVGLNGYYDFTNAENRKAKSSENGALFWSGGIKRGGFGDINTRPKTHHRSIGAFVNISIPVSMPQ